jgi:hypothetical protein
MHVLLPDVIYVTLLVLFRHFQESPLTKWTKDTGKVISFLLFANIYTTTLLQPMNQGTIATFKAYYTRKTSEQTIAKTIEDNVISLTEFWKNYNIRHAIENIHHAWRQTTANNMRGVWKRILPHCANSSDFEEETVQQEIRNIGRKHGYGGLENDGVRKLLNSQSEELTDDDLLFDQQRAFEGADNDTEE